VNPPPPWVRELDTPTNLKRLRWLVSAVLVLSLLAFVARGADNPKDPTFAPVGTPTRQLMPGFGETVITVRIPTGNVLAWCLLLAITDAQHQRGLMQVTDATLGGYDGMVFRWDHDVDEQFWMRNTPMPLTIAYVDAAGHLVSAQDMAPCGDDPSCPSYPAGRPYRFAIEVPQGGLARLGIDANATVSDDRTGCG